MARALSTTPATLRLIAPGIWKISPIRLGSTQKLMFASKYGRCESSSNTGTCARHEASSCPLRYRRERRTTPALLASDWPSDFARRPTCLDCCLGSASPQVSGGGGASVQPWCLSTHSRRGAPRAPVPSASASTNSTAVTQKEDEEGNSKKGRKICKAQNTADKRAQVANCGDDRRRKLWGYVGSGGAHAQRSTRSGHAAACANDSCVGVVRAILHATTTCCSAGVRVPAAPPHPTRVDRTLKRVRDATAYLGAPPFFPGSPAPRDASRARSSNFVTQRGNGFIKGKEENTAGWAEQRARVDAAPRQQAERDWEAWERVSVIVWWREGASEWRQRGVEDRVRGTGCGGGTTGRERRGSQCIAASCTNELPGKEPHSLLTQRLVSHPDAAKRGTVGWKRERGAGEGILVLHGWMRNENSLNASSPEGSDGLQSTTAEAPAIFARARTAWRISAVDKREENEGRIYNCRIKIENGGLNEPLEICGRAVGVLQPRFFAPRPRMRMQHAASMCHCDELRERPWLQEGPNTV
ncbi:hypothetical protein B0H17DRAFT_1180666 [Mycena rosella]|uniref:Uncharacterized protein n=1 Tax=Mycena rosella TaxID=1033263 RepID=A0AAD7DDW4_MYCRO|nr:hypothetical protein B0H17DRAFT_1180666 [Mycena rosella]